MWLTSICVSRFQCRPLFLVFLFWRCQRDSNSGFVSPFFFPQGTNLSFVPSPPRKKARTRQKKKGKKNKSEDSLEFIITMTSSVPISAPSITAPTPQNTPLQRGTIPSGLSRPTVPVISEDGEEGSDVPMDGKDDPLAGLQQHMAGMVQSRLAGLIGKSSGYIEGLPVDVKLNVEALKGIQVQYYELQNKYRLECLALERKVCFFFPFFFFGFGFFFLVWIFLAIKFAALLGLVFSTVCPLDWTYRFIRDHPRSKALGRAFEALSHTSVDICLILIILNPFAVS